MPNPTQAQRLEVSIQGMDCQECTRHVQRAIAEVPGVQHVDVFLGSEKAVIHSENGGVSSEAVRQAVTEAGYNVADSDSEPNEADSAPDYTKKVMSMFGLVFGGVLLIVVLGEWLGLIETLTERVPTPLGWLIVAVAGYPVFRKVIQATLKKQIVSHTLMSVGAIAALIVGQWATAVIVVFFMRVGDYVESFTAERARRAVKDLTALAPQTARIEQNGEEVELPISQVQPGHTVVIRPGETIPVDGEVIAGQATVNQSAITGESMPVETGPGDKVFAATLAQLGSLRVRATHIGPDSTFGRVIKLVEEAEAHRADVQRMADKFSAWYLPLVASIAALTYIISRDALATAAVLVVACSCSIALATPIAVLASIGAGAKQGLLIKGGKHLETLAKADVLLLDKTGTLTLGQPQVTQIQPLNGLPADDILALAATAERYSEHPLAEAVRQAARAKGLVLGEPEDFSAVPGQGVTARIKGATVAVGNRKLVQHVESLAPVAEQVAQGHSSLIVARNGEAIGLITTADTPRPEVPAALAEVRRLGIRHIEILTGDHEQAAAALVAGGPNGVGALAGVSYRANLLPEDKIAVVKEYQAKGHTVVMVGDGVNDAPALAQADVGIAMGSGTDIALEAGHVTLLRNDWDLVPTLFRVAQRTMRIVKLNLGFTGVYNVVGITLAALGILPPVLAAAAQSIPDVGILLNSSRLLRQKE